MGEEEQHDDLRMQRGARDELESSHRDVAWWTKQLGHVPHYLDEARTRQGRPASTPDADEGRDASDEGTVTAPAVAEESAAAMRTEAEREASTRRNEACRYADRIEEVVKQEVQAHQALAERLLTEAQEAASLVREAADRYAVERRAEAEERAVQILRDSELRSAPERLRQRQRVLVANLSESEARLRRLATNLRGVASALDELVDAPVANGAQRRE